MQQRIYLIKIFPEFDFNIIDNINIIKVIGHLENKTSCDVDGISNSSLKSIKSEIVHPLTVLIDQMLMTESFPNKLKVAKVVPLYKKGDNTFFSNYRPKSILPSLSKIFQTMFTHSSMPILKVINYSIAAEMHKRQYGFKQGHSTEFAAVELSDKITF